MHILHIADEVTPTQLLGATSDERARADEAIDRLRQEPNGLRDYLLSEVRALAGSAQQGTSQRYRLCELAVALQAVSCGQVHYSVNPRLSMLLLSDPAKGKKHLGLQAELLAPISQTVQPTVISPPGLTARIEQKKHLGWIAHPGALPLCSGGTLIYEDQQRTPKNHLNAVLGAFNSTAEDGKIAPQKAAATTYWCRTALHINANRQVLVTPELLEDRTVRGPLGRCKLAGITPETFSRLDIVVDMDAEDDAMEGAKHIATQPIAQILPMKGTAREARERELKLLVARLMERFPHVELCGVRGEIEQVVEHAATLMRSWASKMSPQDQRDFDVDMLLRRMANSIRKLVGASARLSGRGEATADDVRCAWRMLGFK